MKLTIALLFTLLVCTANISAQNTEFTYQGSLKDGVVPANGSYDFKFRLFDVVSGGAEIAATDAQGIAVSNGIFTVRLDFGSSAFREAPRYLEILVKPAGGPTYVTLTPRQPVTSAPHAIKSLSADTAQTAFFANNATDATNATNATNAAQLGGIAASQYVVTTDPRMTDTRDPLPNSANYVQNTTSPQATSNFNISGDGTAGGTLSGNAVNAVTQYNLGGSRILTTSAFFGNIFAGNGAGAVNTTGGENSFFGQGAGQSNVAGGGNSFFGRNAGNSNTASNNSFFGEQSGFGTSTGGQNSFFGQFSGRNNITGSDNAFFGYRAGQNNTASGNSFFGSGAGNSVTAGQWNSFFGRGAGAAVITGFQNSFFGYNAGLVNTATGNSIFGAFAGDNNTTGTGNSFFGNAAGTTNVTGSDNSFFGYNAGLVNTGGGNSFFGSLAGDSNTSSGGNSFFGASAGAANTTGQGNSFFGAGAGDSNTTGSFNSFFGRGAADGYSTGTRNSHFGYLSFSSSGVGNNNDNSFFGHDAGQSMVGDENTVIGSGAGNGGGNSNTFVGFEAGDASLAPPATGRNTAVGAEAVASGGTSTALGFNARALSGLSTAIGANAFAASPNTIQLGTSGDTVRIDGRLTVDNLGSGGSISLCMSGSSLNLLSDCSSSLRYKTHVQSFLSGLDIVRRLRPITFSWKDGGKRDVGFAAEEVEQIEPLLTTYNDKGEIEGVKYAQITTVLVNAVKEQQQTIEQQQRQIDELKKLVCLSHPRADVCKDQEK